MMFLMKYVAFWFQRQLICNYDVTTNNENVSVTHEDRKDKQRRIIKAAAVIIK